MTTPVHWVNTALTHLFDGILWPLAWLGDWGVLCGCALLAAAGTMDAWPRLTDPERVRRSRERLQASLLAGRLFPSDPRVLLGVQVRALGRALAYLRHTLLPALVLGPLFLVGYLQLDGRLGLRPLRPGEATVLVVSLDGASAFEPERLELEAGSGLRVDSPPVRSPAGGEVAWRLRATEPGTHTVVVRAGDHRVEKRVTAGAWRGLLSSVRSGNGWLDLLLHPGEPPIPEPAGLAAVAVRYPRRWIRLWGRRLPWGVPFLGLFLAAGYGFKRAWGVEV
ncbi:MAG: hypothetical protein AB1505_19435 [Candidatus Latescibacterota bacterium]